jgi:hypothetical protein
LPGDSLIYTATLEFGNGNGAMVSATSHKGKRLQAEAEIMFAYVDDQVPRASGFDGESEPVEKVIDADTALFAQGDAPDLIYTIEEGRFEVVRSDLDGGEIVLAHLGAGDYVGEMGPLFGLPRSATVRAVELSRVIGHSPKSFRETLDVETLNKVIAGRTGRTDQSDQVRTAAASDS